MQEVARLILAESDAEKLHSLGRGRPAMEAGEQSHALCPMVFSFA
jgi:hypothetical protein